MQPKLLDTSKIEGQKILAIGAHSDDLEFGAGGTLVQLRERNEIQVIQVTDSRMGTHAFDTKAEDVVQARIQEASAAAKIYGAEVKYWSYGDMYLKNHIKQLERRLVKTFLKERPNIIITFDPWARYEVAVHPDHRALSMTVVESVMKATLPVWVQKHGLGRRLLSPKPSVWLMAPAEANVVVDVADNWEVRLDLVRSFLSQIDEEVTWEMVERWLVETSAYAGFSVGIEKGEGFRILEYDGRWNKE